MATNPLTIEDIEEPILLTTPPQTETTLSQPIIERLITEAVAFDTASFGDPAPAAAYVNTLKNCKYEVTFPNLGTNVNLYDLTTEWAYNIYARGWGDVLGQCNHIRAAGTGDVTLSYQWIGTTIPTTLPTLGTAGPIFTLDGNSTVDAPWWNLTYQVGFDVGTSNSVIYDWLSQNPLTPEELAARAAEDAARMARVQVINKKAEQLLLAHLSEVQRKSWLAEKWFPVTGQSGRRYAITEKAAHNVYLDAAA